MSVEGPVLRGEWEGALRWAEFVYWRDGVQYALDGGLWLHRHWFRGHAMAHLVSSDRRALEAYGYANGLHPARLQHRPLKDPRSGHRRETWHWDLVGPWLPGRNPDRQPVGR